MEVPLLIHIIRSCCTKYGALIHCVTIKSIRNQTTNVPLCSLINIPFPQQNVTFYQAEVDFNFVPADGVEYHIIVSTQGNCLTMYTDCHI